MTDLPAGFEAYSKVVQRHIPSKEGEEKKETEPQANGRFIDVTEYWLSEDEPGECVPTGQAPNVAALARSRYGENSLLLRRIVVPGRSQKLQLELQSNSLQRVFRDVTGDLATVNVHADPIVLAAPYHELYHFRKELRKVQETTKDQLVKRELQLLKDFEDEHLSRTMKIKEIDDHKGNGTITFEYLWALFKPHQLVIMQTDLAGTEPVYFCAIFQKFSISSDARFWYLDIEHMSFDGTRFGRVEKTLQFSAFMGVRNIRSLPVYPYSYHQDKPGLRMKLEERGKSFIKLCKGGQDEAARGYLCDYQGPVWIRGRVLIDPRGFAGENPLFRESIMSNTTNKSSDGPRTVHTDNITSDDLICFPAQIAGYSLVTKHIGFFHISGLHDVSWEKEEALSMFNSSSNMRAIHRIISGYSYRSSSFGYSIADKGKGLVFLFYGPSGTGKTLTAECVAEHLRRPLYRASGADLGSGTYEVESNLQAAFDRIARWKAILLLDEADAFMTKRSDDSLERNNLVTILLRLLEYQSGIVILTTNREKQFDEAFHSRIHVTIGFPALTSTAREAIWRKQFKFVAGKQQLPGLSDKDFAALSELKLDGRSIKNVYHIAWLHMNAGGSSGVVSLRDLKEVLPIALGDVSPELKKQIQEFCEGT
ncbi:P-loop containing nucleoside triphosphate hydrolase protein [Stachybotrys elegans]|uniref:P-loop containing nucleoside triphosphate hydrolase protein n=1 Tax=Stachybotrys elegans TaxID=80388 RepID=A0A8K0SER1_9HYPO|nr:P-loop containing nucleoside triphosphate hydrolase protein [Stachybotrys elegans]